MYMPLRITKQRCSSKNHVTFSHYFGERRTFSGPSPAIPMSYLALVGAPAEKSRSQAGSWVSDESANELQVSGCIRLGRSDALRSIGNQSRPPLDFSVDLLRARRDEIGVGSEPSTV